MSLDVDWTCPPCGMWLQIPSQKQLSGGHQKGNRNVAPKDNMEENSGGGAERNELQLEHHSTDAWRQAYVEGFYHFPKCQRE